MVKYLFSCAMMQRNAAVIAVVCILFCLTFNYTFPLHRVSKKWSLNPYHNHTPICDASKSRANIADRAKKIKNSFSEDDLRQYEQLVIMKKNPYLDLRELEIKLSPSQGKHVRQSLKFDGGTNIAGDSGICESIEDGPSVEIINRGLTGFAIPAKISKVASILDTKTKFNEKEAGNGRLKPVKLTKADVLGSLQDGIKEYEARRREEKNKLHQTAFAINN